MQKLSSLLSVFLVLTLVLGGLTACKPGPESAELLELERMLQDPSAKEIRETPGASRFYQESRQFRRLAREAHSERKDDLSREYAVLGTLRYRTAVAIASQFEAKERLEAANAKVEEVNPQLKAINEERNKLAREINEIEQRIATLVRQKAQRDQAEAAKTEHTFNPDTGKSQGDSVAATRKVKDAETARKKALEVKADEFSQAIFERAEQQYRSAVNMLNTHPDSTDVILQHAEHALMLFGQAHDDAKPKYEDFQRKMQPEARISAIRTHAQNNFGGPYTFNEQNGVRIVMARLFEPKTANFRFNTDSLLSAVANLANEYHEFSISIEGYTSKKGGATENLATSQLRAQKVREFLVGKGIKSDRVNTQGFGQDRIRYSDDVENNDRVEIIFRLSR